MKRRASMTVMTASSMLMVCWPVTGSMAAGRADGAQVRQDAGKWAFPEVRRATVPSSFMRVYGFANPPYGVVRFCEANPQECVASDQTERVMDYTLWKDEVERINAEVNGAFKPRTDLEMYGVTELWTLPTDKGADCEDYALLKRKLLMKRGWPASALLMTVVRDERGEGHAVLTARTKQGDFVLDNKTDFVKPWRATPYQYVMRQSYLNPKVWMALEDPAMVAQRLRDLASVPPQR